MSKRHYSARVAPETTPGVRPTAINYSEIDLPGADISLQRSLAQSNRVKKDLVPRRGKKGPPSISFQGTTDFGFRYGGEPILLAAGYGAPEIPAALGSADSIEAANNAVVRNGGWGVLGVTAGQMLLVGGATNPANPAVFLAPVVEVAGNQARIDPSFVTLSDETSPLTINHAGAFRVGGNTRTLTYESWNSQTARGDEVNGVTVNSWGINVQYGQGQQGGQSVQQSFGLAGLAHQKLTAQIGETTNSAAEIAPFDSGSSFGDKVYPSAGFGFRYNGTVLSEIFWDQIQVQMQAPVRNRAGAGHDSWQRLIRDQDISITLTVTFGRRERPTDTHQDLIIDGAQAGDVASIGFGFRDELDRRSYLYLPVLEPENVRLPGPAASGDDTVQITYRAYAEETTVWGPLFLSFFNAPA